MARPIAILVLTLPALALPLAAATRSVDCNRGQSLNTAVQNSESGDTVSFSGVCHENVLVQVSGVTLSGQGGATISPSATSSDALTVDGAQRVTLENATVQNGRNGVHALGGAAIVLRNVVAQNNAQTGILVEASSSATLSNTTAQHNGLHGIDAENSSSLTFSGNVTSQQNGVFGINVANSSSATLNAGTVTAQQNALGIQVSISSSFFLGSPAAILRALNNFTVGLTMVSGAHFFAFGGAITASGNGLDGIDLASRAGMDLDAGTQASSFNNQRDGVHAEELSLVNLFNNPQFSGVPGFTTLQVYGNAGNGMSLLGNAQLHMFAQAQIQSHNNTGQGIQVDDGSSITLLNSTVQSNPTDITLTFGSRGDLRNNTIGKLTCDASSLIRGDSGKNCPAR